ncbi:MAG: sulfatase [Phycisphaerales bacterium]|nr:sulfatase [Phycisphaerales bacterium]
MPTTDTEPNTDSPPSRMTVGAYVWCALRIALIGCVLVAVGECIAAGWVTLPLYSPDHWPWGILIAAVGKALVTHLLAWGPVCVVVAIVCGLLLRRRAGIVPEAVMVPVFVLLAGGLIAPFDLTLAERDTPTRIVLLRVLACVVAVGLFLVVRWVARRCGRRAVLRVLNAATMAAGVVTVIVGLAFAGSPMFDPAAYRAAIPQQNIKYRPEHPNLLWIVMDTVRGDHLNYHGYSQETAPRVAEFSKDAVVFDHAVSNGTWTLPSHSSMFTGKSVREHGAEHRYRHLSASFGTVAEVLRDHGYATAAFSNNPWVSPDTDLTRGFDVARVVYHLRHVNRSSAGAMAEALGWSPVLPWLDEDFGGAMTNALIADWLAQQVNEAEPFFLFVNYMDAHLPYRVPREYRAKFMSDEQVYRSYELAQSAYGGIVRVIDYDFNFDGRDFFAMSDREVLRRQYDAGIRYTDMRMGELLDMFDKSGLLDNTLVVIVSDHGEYLDTHGMWAHRMQAYQDLLHVTMILRPPGGGVTLRVDTPVQHSDLYGTILNATVGLADGKTAWHARDLFALAGEAEAQDRVVVSEYCGPAPGNLKRILASKDPDIPPRASPQIAAQDMRYKFIATADGRRELYDLLEDPGELNNLVDQLPAEAQRLADYLTAWHEQTPLFKPPAGEEADDLDPDVIRALKSLGYLGEDDK